MKNHSRSNRSSIAKDTLDVLEKGYYEVNNRKVDVGPAVKNCNEKTKLYTPETLEALTPVLPNYNDATIELVNETSLEGAKRLADTGKYQRIGLLNFASAKNPGGGFLGGSQAQEETLARSSALYNSLLTCPEYYDFHKRQQKSLLYSDRIIVSPSCPVFKEDSGAYLDSPYEVDFITSPAPNRGAIARNEPASLERIDAAFAQRINAVLRVAVEHECDALILGAWGCGVFGNLPEQVAGLFADAVTGDGEFAHAFQHISFSIPENAKTQANTLAFKAALGVA